MASYNWSDRGVFLFILALTVVNLVQAIFTEIHNDESYYWFYTTQIQWGYYEHPPMVALFAWFGTILFDGTLSIRFTQILALAISLWFFFKMFKNSAEVSFAMVVFCSVPFLNYLFFTVFPDGPLLFFLTIFLAAYQSHCQRQEPWKVVAMAIAMAGMLYSKYHAVLIMPLILLGNGHYLKKRWFYQVIALASVLYIPHLSWQYQNDFPSFQFHLSGRSRPFKLSYLLDFVGQQIIAVGPVLALAILRRPVDEFEKSLKAVTAGIIVFFFLMSFRGFVHIQWTSLAYIPSLYLAARYVTSTSQQRKCIWILAPFILIHVLLRVFLMFPLFGLEKLGSKFVHGQEEWAHKISSVTKEASLVYEYDLKEPSMYSFYQDKPSLALYPGHRKSSQYNLWNVEDKLQLKPAIIAREDPFLGSQELVFRARKMYYKKVDSLVSLQNIKCNILKVDRSSSEARIEVEINNHRSSALNLDREEVRFLLRDTMKQLDRDFYLTLTAPAGILTAESTKVVTFLYEGNLPIGTYNFMIDDGLLSPSFNSGQFQVK